MRSKLDRRELLVLTGAACATAAVSPVAAGRAARRVGRPVEGQPPAVEASWWEAIGDKRVACKLCPQACQVADAERGMCGVRENRDGAYYTLVHGMSCSLHADPIEKKPFFHVLPGSRALSYATAGCNVECKFCQNWEISQFRPEQVRSVWMPPKAMVRAARQGGMRLLAATYSEPVVFWEYVRDISVEARRHGVRSTVVSNGYIELEPLREVLPHLSAVKVDLKSFREKFYVEQVRGHLKPVLEALEVIRKSGVWLEIVVLLIPTLNDSETEIRELSTWVKANLGPDVPVHFTRFHPTYRLKNLPPTPVKTLERAWRTAQEVGLQFVYVGNVPGHPGESTRCPECGKVVVRRFGYRVVEMDLEAGACPECGRSIPGVWR